MRKREAVKRMFGRRFWAGGYSALAAVLVIAIAVAVNLMAGALPEDKTQLDLTSQAIFTLGDQTRRVVASLDRDVTLSLLANSGREDETVSRLLERYAGLSSRIAVRYIDPTEQPTFLDQYDLDISTLYANSVLVESGDRVRLVGYDEIFVTSYSMDYSTYGYTTSTSFEGENALTNAIHYVTRDDLPVVYVLGGHGEAELSGSVESLMERDNLVVQSLSLLSQESVPQDASAVIINAPQSDISSDEADMLIAYMEGGGNVVLMTDYIEQGGMENLLRVTRSMGLTVGEGIIVEDDRTRHLNRYPYYLLPEIESHEITEPVISGGYYILTPLAQPIEEAEDAGAQITWLLTTSSSAYSKIEGLNMQTTSRAEGDIDGPFHVGALAEKDGGRLFFVTSSDLLSEAVDAMVAGANSDLFMNALSLMCGQEETISIRAKSLDGESLTLTGAQSSFWSAVLVGMVPGVLILVGVVVMIRRKRR